MEAVVKFDYSKQEDDELDLKVGDVIIDVKEVDDGWCEGVLNGVKGVFPDNFVECRPATAAATDTKPVITAKPVATANPVTLRDTNKPKARRYRVVYSYAAENEDEISLAPGSFVDVLDEEEEGWWRGRVGDKEGVFPSNFVEEIKESPQQPSPPAAQQTPAPTTAPAPTPTPTPAPSQAPPPPANEAEKSAPPPVDNRPLNFGPRVLLGNPADALKKLKSTSKPPPPQPKKTTPPKESHHVEKAKVMFDYTAENPDELTIKTDDILEVLEKDTQDGWWKVSRGDKSGFVPDNFLKLLPPESNHSPAPPPPAKKLPHHEPPKREPEEKEKVPPGVPVKPPAVKKKPTEGKRPPPIPKMSPAVPHSNANSNASSEVDGPDSFGVPDTEQLDVSAVKNRPKSMGRPPSKSNLLQSDEEPAAEPVIPNWKEDLNKRKYRPVPVAKKPATPSPLSTRRAAGIEPEKKPQPSISHTKSVPTIPKQNSETKVTPPPAMQDSSWKGEFERLEKEFESFKSSMRQQFESFKKDCLKDIEILTQDLDNERKKTASLQIDVDRLKKTREFRDNI